MRLKDIIDLEYFVHIDDDLESRGDIQSLSARDREIYTRCESSSLSGKSLLLAWLAERKKQFIKDKNSGERCMLPGSGFALVYTVALYAMILLGSLFGFFTTYSLLAYHGARPVNVTLFVFLFIGLPVVFMLLSAAGPALGKKNRPPVFHLLLSGFCFKLLPELFSRIRFMAGLKAMDTMEYTYAFIRMKNREYENIFFWPFFILTSVFAFCFSGGVFCALFFKVLISDVAFGWQSTLVSAGIQVYDIVSIMALPWSWILPPHLSHPTLEQIEGSRIILKDGIHMLATGNLVSWWPFVCAGVLCYTIIPRGLFVLGGVLSMERLLKRIDFDHPRFTALLVRMKSPVLNIDEKKKSAGRQADRFPEEKASPSPEKSHTEQLQKAVLLLPDAVYGDAEVQAVALYLKTRLATDVMQVVSIGPGAELGRDTVEGLQLRDIDRMVLLHEVWQPPIRGTLYDINQLKNALPDSIPLWILLTQDPGQCELSIKPGDINFEVWKKAVLKLGNPDICVQRMQPE